jgi:hypothetical protein
MLSFYFVVSHVSWKIRWRIQVVSQLSFYLVVSHVSQFIYHSCSQPSLQSKFPRRDLNHPFEWPTHLQAKHFINDFHVFVTLEDLSPKWIMVVQESLRLWWTSESLYYPPLHGNLLVENWTRSWWSFGEVWDREISGSLWVPQWRRR